MKNKTKMIHLLMRCLFPEIRMRWTLYLGQLNWSNKCKLRNILLGNCW